MPGSLRPQKRDDTRPVSAVKDVAELDRPVRERALPTMAETAFVSVDAAMLTLAAVKNRAVASPLVSSRS